MDGPKAGGRGAGRVGAGEGPWVAETRARPRAGRRTQGCPGGAHRPDSAPRGGARRYEQPGIAEALPPPWAAASWSSPHRVASETSQCPLTLTALPAMPLSMTVPFNEI